MTKATVDSFAFFFFYPSALEQRTLVLNLKKSQYSANHPWQLPTETRPMDNGKSNNRNAQENLFLFFSFVLAAFPTLPPSKLQHHPYAGVCKLADTCTALIYNTTAKE